MMIPCKSSNNALTERSERPKILAFILGITAMCLGAYAVSRALGAPTQACVRDSCVRFGR